MPSDAETSDKSLDSISFISFDEGILGVIWCRFPADHQTMSGLFWGRSAVPSTLLTTLLRTLPSGEFSTSSIASLRSRKSVPLLINLGLCQNMKGCAAKYRHT